MTLYILNPFLFYNTHVGVILATILTLLCCTIIVQLVLGLFILSPVPTFLFMLSLLTVLALYFYACNVYTVVVTTAFLLAQKS